jgi:hypothetical protein
MPREIEEAAVIDGAGYWRIYWSVILPLSKPILSALAILFFLANWNAFLWPLTVASDQNLWVVQVGSSTSRASIRPLGTGKPSRASKRRSGDFFGMGHARTRNYASLPMQASPEDGKAFNCYFPMPFGSGMKFTITNEAEHDLLFYYYIDLELHDELEDGLGRFHAQYRPERPESFDEIV